MAEIRSVLEFKQQLQDIFDSNEESLERFGENRTTQLKTYLVESTRPEGAIPPAGGAWRALDSPGWYVSEAGSAGDVIVLDATGKRVWRLFSLQKASTSDSTVENWVDSNSGLDFCWLQRGQLFLWNGRRDWIERGVGIRFDDGLSPMESQGYFSLKAWHGAGTGRTLPKLQEVISEAERSFAIYSVRWERRSGDENRELFECYSNGKVTVNKGGNVDDALHFSSELAERYESSLLSAEKNRQRKILPFELNFSQPIDPESFSSTVRVGRGPMNLWLTEVEAEPDFRRYRGVDLHTGDRVLLDLGTDYAYLTVPSPGCVNAAPRLAVVQGEDNAGRTTILQDGVEVFG